jgi:kynureninase
MATLDVGSREYAVSLDAQDPLNHMSKEFFIPSKTELKAEILPAAGMCSTPLVTVMMFLTCDML